MGCHMWLYKKAKNLTTEEKKSYINKLYVNTYKYFVRNISREDFIKSEVEANKEDVIFYTGLIERGEMRPDDFNYNWAKEHSIPEIVGEWYDECINHNKKCDELLNTFMNNTEETDFIETCEQFKNKCFDIHNGEKYANIAFDTYFRCYSYSEKNIDNLEDMVEFLMKCPSTCIEQYGEFDDDGNFHGFETEKIGFSDELYKMLKHLYKDNDIYIYFG